MALGALFAASNFGILVARHLTDASSWRRCFEFFAVSQDEEGEPLGQTIAEVEGRSQ